MALDPSIWGPAYWSMFHFVPYAYEDMPNRSVKEAMKNFIRSIPVLLPCQSCRDHAFEYLTKSDLDVAVSNRETLETFFIDFHNSVNKRLKKPYFSRSAEHLVDRQPLQPDQSLQTGYMLTLMVFGAMLMCILSFLGKIHLDNKQR